MYTSSQTLDDFSNCRIDFAELTTTVGELLEDNAAGSSELMFALEDARGAGALNDEQYHELLERIVLADAFAATPASEPEAADGTTLRISVGSDARDQTRIGAGSIIKERFELDRIPRRGSMGLLFRSRDRIKVEAKDRNPFVVIKILNQEHSRSDPVQAV